jgi:hypothetical protein
MVPLIYPNNGLLSFMSELGLENFISNLIIISIT